MKDMLLRVIALVFVLMLFTHGRDFQPTRAASYPDSDTSATIDNYIKERMQTLKIPGVALALVQGDQIEYLQGYGNAELKGQAVTPQTPFMLASISKSFTALAIMQLIEDGKVDLDDPIQKYLPWFQIADEKAASEITVRHLLYHTAGFSETDGNKMNQCSSKTDNVLVSCMKQLGNTKLLSIPRETFEYSNINYGLLGAVVEAVSGESFETYIKDHIFVPLEMNHSYTSLSKADGAATGYYPFFGVLIPYNKLMPYSHAVTPWAGIFSSAEDLAHYLIAHLNEGHFKDKIILSPEGITVL